MLSLDQVRLLESHVEKAVSKITSLTSENEHLRSQLVMLQQRVMELESFVSGFKDDQGKIEAGILNALEQLGALENAITGETPVESNPNGIISSDSDVPEQDSEQTIAETTSDTEQFDQNPSDEPVQDDGQIDIF